MSGWGGLSYMPVRGHFINLKKKLPDVAECVPLLSLSPMTANFADHLVWKIGRRRLAPASKKD
jgi:hypothetical protein